MSDKKENTGDRNTGDWNTGNRNTGDRNTGDWNTGDRNTGNRNTGDWNTGDWNTGDRNTGDWNTGNRNTGDWNTGDRNTGDWNTGDWNTGDWNTGFFCTETPLATFFDKPSSLSFEEARAAIPYVDLPISCDWIATKDMTEKEKEENPSHKTTGGFLRVFNLKIQEAFPKAWSKLNVETKQRFLNLPNFDADKFLACTGVDVRLDRDLFPKNEPATPEEITLNGKRYRLVTE